MAAEREITAAVLAIHGPLGPVVQQACVEAGINAVSLDDGASLSTPASLVIAELPAGDRRVPQRVLDAVALAGGRARLLLLCAEALVRPHVATQGGRVVMVSPPHTPGRLANRIRVLLADGSPQTAAGDLERRERITDRWWLCSFQSAGTEPGVWLQTADAMGMTAVLPPPQHSAGPELLEQVVDLLSRERSDEARLGGLSELAGPCAVVHLSALSDRWLFCWPSPTWPLWVHSVQRLPPLADVAGRSAHQRTWSMTAAPGDLLLASTAPLGDDEEDRAALRRALEEGGPAAVDLIASRAQDPEVPLCGLAVEVHG